MDCFASLAMTLRERRTLLAMRAQLALHAAAQRWAILASLTKRQSNQPVMVNPLLSVVVYFF
jgi:hypothetical protein